MNKGLSTCLECWQNYMFRNDRDAGYSAMGFLTGEGDSYGDTDSLDMKRENEIAVATDKSIDCLKRHEAWAIKKSRGIARSWCYPEFPYDKSLESGLTKLEAMLKKHIATWSLFSD